MGDTEQKIGPGDFIGFPAGGAAHETVNDGTEQLVCLVIGQRLAQDVVDYPRRGASGCMATADNATWLTLHT